MAEGAWTAIANTHVIVPEDGVEARFLWYLMNDEDFWIKSGSAQPFVKVSQTLEKPIALPPTAEQRRIVDAIEEFFSRIEFVEGTLETLVGRFERGKGRIGAVRRAVLRTAFRGELVLQDPSDEPASVLLERVAAARAAQPKRYRRKRGFSP